MRALVMITLDNKRMMQFLDNSYFLRDALKAYTVEESENDE